MRNLFLSVLLLLSSSLSANANVFYDISAKHDFGEYSGYIEGTPLTGYIELLSNADGLYGVNSGANFPLLSNVVSWSFTDGFTTNSSTNDSLKSSATIRINGGAIIYGSFTSSDFFVSSDFSSIGPVSFDPAIFTLRLTAAAVPEPETYGMMLLGLGLLGFAARRKKLA